MGRSRVLSFMSTFSPTSTSSHTPSPQPSPAPTAVPPIRTNANPSSPTLRGPDSPGSPATPVYPRRASSRPGSMIFHQPPMDVGRDTVPELLPIFTFLNSHANKLYQEGYFLKLNDLDISGRPNGDRSWTECFAQLVGTVLSLWDAAALDAAGQDGEVPPTFINLADASIKMIETLPTRKNDAEPLHNVLSISTAGKNRYLLHFNSLHSLTQWTAGIRLAMFENSSLQELYTGSLIAGKGKELNNIRTIMERIKFKHEDWARVRFGAGTAWQRYWMVISPPDEKDVARHQKSLKKRSAYDRPPVLKGDIKFYETKKTKKVTPIATIKDAYSAYAIYPQSKPLIEQSTLVKLEGKITIHSTPESTTEGFVFVMPDLHAAVSGFEMMLRTLFPAFDVFTLYGRPNRLIADTLDPRSIMFAMPKERRYGYLDIIDVAALIHTDGSDSWSEREWRKRLKEATAKRLTSGGPSRTGSRLGSRQGKHSRAASLQFRETVSARSSEDHIRSSDAVFGTPRKSFTMPDGNLPAHNYHARSASDTIGFGSPRKRHAAPGGSRLSMEIDPSNRPPSPPAHLTPVISHSSTFIADQQERSSSEEDQRPSSAATAEVREVLRPVSPPTPAPEPPAFAHNSRDRPPLRSAGSTESPRAVRMPVAVPQQRGDYLTANGGVAAAGAAAAWKTRENGQPRGPPVKDVSPTRNPAAEARPNLQLAPDSRSSSRPKLSPILSAGLLPDKQLPSTPATKELPQRPITPPQTRSQSSKGISRKPVGGSPTRVPQASPPPVPAHTDATVFPDIVQSPESMASARRSAELERRERQGVLKTVGGQSQGNSSAAAIDLPVIDFGPTQALRPTAKLNTDTKDSRNASYQSQLDQTRPGMGSRSPSNPLISGDELQSRLDNSNITSANSSRPVSRGAFWQPGVATMGTGQASLNRRSMTPEEFVQQRSAAQSKASPVYQERSQSRSSSNLPLSRPASGDWTQSRSSLPLTRQSSGDWTQSRSSTYLPLQRPSSGDWTQQKPAPRPHSRGADTTLSVQPDYTTHMSAREQEHVARMTGTPLVNLPQRSPSPGPSAGLIGAIEAREQEKKNFKEGVSSQLMQQAIAQRQQQEQQRQAQWQQAHHAGNMPWSPTHQQSQYGVPGMPGGWAPTQQSPQYQWSSPQAQVYWGGVPPQHQNVQYDPRAGQYYTQPSPGP